METVQFHSNSLIPKSSLNLEIMVKIIFGSVYFCLYFKWSCEYFKMMTSAKAWTTVSTSISILSKRICNFRAIWPTKPDKMAEIVNIGSFLYYFCCLMQNQTKCIDYHNNWSTETIKGRDRVSKLSKSKNLKSEYVISDQLNKMAEASMRAPFKLEGGTATSIMHNLTFHRAWIISGRILW